MNVTFDTLESLGFNVLLKFDVVSFDLNLNWLDVSRRYCFGLLSWKFTITIEYGPVEIVSFPIKNGHCPYFCKPLPEGIPTIGQTHMDIWDCTM